MSKRDAFWEKVLPKDADEVLWPASRPEREVMARDMVGATVVGALEAICQERLSIVAGTEPKPGSASFKEKVAQARVFASMSSEQRDAAREVVLDTCLSSLYWMLLKLEHMPGASVDITVQPHSSPDTEAPCSVEGGGELHWLYDDWIARFSDLTKPK